GFKFISYAVWWIRQSILQALAEQSRIVRLPLNQVGSLNKISKATAKFEQENMREPSLEELSALTGQDERTITKAISADQHHVSFDKPFQDGEDNTLLDVMPSGQADRADRIVDQQSLEHDIQNVLDHVLNERESFIIRKAFGLGEQSMGLEYIGEELGLTRERVRQICDKGIRKLQESGKAQILQKYL
ncbi:MAG: sigma-70 family RNA polymerase sigma factor, partial [Bacteroidaceae bacterium]|nr:sigma-70 family RNA polymerase sigma factor [Bacteroidaceae bacterium]